MGQIPLIKEMPKECPFCHDIPIVAKDPLWNESHGYYGNYEYYVACKNGNGINKKEIQLIEDGD